MKAKTFRLRVVLKTGQSFLTEHAAGETFSAKDLTTDFLHKMVIVRLPFLKKRAIFVQGDNIAYMVSA